MGIQRKAINPNHRRMLSSKELQRVVPECVGRNEDSFVVESTPGFDSRTAQPALGRSRAFLNGVVRRVPSKTKRQGRASHHPIHDALRKCSKRSRRAGGLRLPRSPANTWEGRGSESFHQEIDGALRSPKAFGFTRMVPGRGPANRALIEVGSFPPAYVRLPGGKRPGPRLG